MINKIGEKIEDLNNRLTVLNSRVKTKVETKLKEQDDKIYQIKNGLKAAASVISIALIGYLIYIIL